jgi:adenylate cyclase
MARTTHLPAVDIVLVEEIRPVRNGVAADEHPLERYDPATLAAAMRRLSDLTDPAQLLTELLAIVRKCFGFEHAMVLLNDPERRMSTAAAAIGYDVECVDAEVPNGVGLIGKVAVGRRSMRINDMLRVRRTGIAAAPSAADETRHVALPGLTDARSQIAVSLSIQGTVKGVLFAESRRAFAFDPATAAALELVAQYAAAILALQQMAGETAARVASSKAPSDGGRTVSVLYHHFDQSIFIDRTYVIKGVAGQILAYMLKRYTDTLQTDFTNREIRVSISNALPDLRDNLETRLLLLRRRLEGLQLPIRLLRTGRGRLRLELGGRVDMQWEN